MKKTVISIFFVVCLFSKIFAGHLFICTGPSSIGKSSLMVVLKQIRPEIEVIAQDEVWEDECLTYLQQHEGVVFERVNSLIGKVALYAVVHKRNDVFLEKALANKAPSTDIYADLQTLKDAFWRRSGQGWLDQVNARIRDAARSSLEKGKTVVLDTALVDDSLDIYKEFRPTVILCFAPFTSLVRNLLVRNAQALSTGNALMWRDPLRAYLHYAQFFKNSRNTQIGTVEMHKGYLLQEVREAHDRYPTCVPSCFETLPLFEQKILDEMEIGEQDAVKLVPKVRYDVLLDMDQYTTTQLMSVFDSDSYQ